MLASALKMSGSSRNQQRLRMMTSISIMLFVIVQVHETTSWVLSSSPIPSPMTTRTSQTSLCAYLQPDETGPSFSSFQQIRRLSTQGVSLSPNGFQIILQNPLLVSNQAEENHEEKAFFPVQVTDAHSRDEFAATSAESLTIIQLLSGVDMAGAILPPDVLARMVVLHCEESLFEDEEEDEKTTNENVNLVRLKKKISDSVRETLPEGAEATSYTEAHEWSRSKVRLPTVTLDEVKIKIVPNQEPIFILDCTIPDFGRISFTPSSDILQEICYDYSPSSSLSFISIALALRYKAPIVLPKDSSSNVFVSMKDIQKRFPMYKSVQALKQSSNRVHQNIEKGYIIHKLTAALQIAKDKGDTEAEKKIRAKLDEYDSMEDLPTTTTTTISPSSTATESKSTPSLFKVESENKEEKEQFYFMTGDDDTDENILQ